MRSREGTATYGGSPSAGSSRSRVFCGTCACSNDTPAAARSLAAGATARLIDWAPCDPPNTSSTRASSANPKWARAFARCAIRSSEVIADRTGTPTTSARGRPQSATAESTRRAERVGPARAGVGFVHDNRQPAAARGKVGGHRDVAAEPDHDIGVDVVEDATGLPDGTAHPPRQPQQVDAGLTRQ